MPVVATDHRPSARAPFGVAWNWEYDADFIHLLDRAFFEAGLACYRVGPHNLLPTMREVERGEREFAWFLDRASDEDARFLPLNRLLAARGTRFLNAHHHYQRAIDKANIHDDLQTRGLELPLTVILPAWEAEPEFDHSIIDALRKPFVVKPARGGGGVGVVLDATLPEHVNRTRNRLRGQRLLLQQRVTPQILNGRRAWFRVYHVCGEIIPCWWDDRTHRYTMFGGDDHAAVGGAELERIVGIIAEVAQLEFFSAEIALDAAGRHLVVDYVNDPCDMRLQSKCGDGVPDAIVRRIVAGLARHVRAQFTSVVDEEMAGHDQAVAHHEEAQQAR